MNSVGGVIRVLNIKIPLHIFIRIYSNSPIVFQHFRVLSIKIQPLKIYTSICIQRPILPFASGTEMFGKDAAQNPR